MGKLVVFTSSFEMIALIVVLMEESGCIRFFLYL